MPAAKGPFKRILSASFIEEIFNEHAEYEK
jgi:hypothetical protein